MLKVTSAQTPVTRLPTEARQAEIVAAALRLAQDCSPAAITTTDLAKAVGLSQGALFKHFPTKDAVWLAAMTWVAQHLLRTLNEAALQASTPLEALRCVFDAHVDFVVTHPGVPRVIFHELQQAEDSPLKQQVRGLMQGYRQLLVRLLKAAVQRGDAPADLDESAASILFLGIVQGLVMQSMLSGQISGMRTEAPRVFQLYLCGIRKTP
ncbi:MAG: TetR/AcrR family transcriptional regulator [Rhodoferax sp.]|uniref:TetR/AcrR family transcriptional regulator n=1 Tax=Rhodoferax sp. TaxID=50421 RepID=UPI003019FFDF